LNGSCLNIFQLDKSICADTLWYINLQSVYYWFWLNFQLIWLANCFNSTDMYLNFKPEGHDREWKLACLNIFQLYIFRYILLYKLVKCLLLMIRILFPTDRTAVYIILLANCSTSMACHDELENRSWMTICVENEILPPSETKSTSSTPVSIKTASMYALLRYILWLGVGMTRCLSAFVSCSYR
jgi:hypothetical protein